MKEELKNEIRKLLEEAPEHVLQDVLTFLKRSQHSATDKKQLSEHLNRILSEDAELLHRLAQ